MIIQVIFFFTFFITNSISIEVENGIIKIPNNISCNVTLNDKENVVNLNSTNPLKLYFGILDLVCYNKSSQTSFTETKISRIKCSDCGVFCLQNDILPGCDKHQLPYYIGLFIIGVVLIFLYCIIFLSCKFCKCCQIFSIKSFAQYMYQKKLDQKETKRVLFNIKKLRINAYPKYKNEYNLKKKYKEKIQLQRFLNTIIINDLNDDLILEETQYCIN